MDKMIAAVIPARGGSKGVPKKNIRILGGMPLIYYAFNAARHSKYVKKMILSTDDDEIAAVGKSLGIEVPFLRPKHLSGDNSSLISVIKHALKYFDSEGVITEGIISLQPTCPFLSTQSIDKAIELWMKTSCDSVTTVAAITKGHPYISKRLRGDHVIENFITIPDSADNSRRQVRETAYYLTGGLYMRSRHLVESEISDSHYLGKDSRAVVVSEVEAIDINTEFDFKIAEFVAEKWKLNNENTVL
jgi:CMP-N-acetylneuraminic acid synthetase